MLNTYKTGGFEADIKACRKGQIEISTFDGEFLFVFIAWIFRRNSCRNGYGRRHCDYPFVDAYRGRGAKNSPSGELIFLSANEYRCAQKTSRKRTFEDGRTVKNCASCRDSVGGRSVFNRLFSRSNFTKSVRRLFGVISDFCDEKRFKKSSIKRLLYIM